MDFAHWGTTTFYQQKLKILKGQTIINIKVRKSHAAVHMCIGFAWQGFGSRAATGVASVRNCWKLPLGLTQPVPASSKMDLPLAKAKLITGGGSASVITYLRRGTRNLQQERGICARNNSADTEVSEEGGEGGAAGTGAEILLQPMMKTKVRQAVSLKPMEVNGGAEVQLQPMEDPTPKQMDA